MSSPVAVVTGSSGGIGSAIVKKLAAEGYRVVVNYHSNKAPADEVAEAIKAQGGTAITVSADVASSEGAEKLIDTTIQEYGQIDVLVNNAGINRDQLMLRMSDEDWQHIVYTNLNAAFFCSRAALKHMVRKRFGRIITISSVVGLGGNAGQAHYATAKAGLLGLSASIAREYGVRGITSNVIAPGFIKTNMTNSLNEKQTKKLLENIALGRLGEPEDIAPVVAFLASPAANYITAQCIRVDGGMIAL